MILGDPPPGPTARRTGCARGPQRKWVYYVYIKYTIILHTMIQHDITFPERKWVQPALVS